MTSRPEHRCARSLYSAEDSQGCSPLTCVLVNYASMWGNSAGSAGKESACNAEDPGLITGSGTFLWRRDRLRTAGFMGFPGGSEGKESAYGAGYLGSIRELRRSPGKGNGYPLQCSCLENPMDRGAWWATVHGVGNSQTWLSDIWARQSTSQFLKKERRIEGWGGVLEERTGRENVAKGKSVERILDSWEEQEGRLERQGKSYEERFYSSKGGFIYFQAVFDPSLPSSGHVGYNL